MYAVIYVKTPQKQRIWTEGDILFSDSFEIDLFLDATVFEMRNNPLGN